MPNYVVQDVGNKCTEVVPIDGCQSGFLLSQKFSSKEIGRSSKVSRRSSKSFVFNELDAIYLQ